MTEDASLVLLERRNGYAIVTLNRPDKRNAVTSGMAQRLREVLADVENMPVVVITGVGVSFCAGVDLKQRDGQPRSFRQALGADGGQYWADTIDAMRRHPAVFIAAVNGYALGGGVTLVNNSELAVAAASARFGMPELGFSSYPALAGPTTLKRVLPKHAFQMALTRERVSAETACRWGLVNEVVPDEQLMARAMELATAVSSINPVALAFTKRALREAIELGWVAGIEHGAEVSKLIQAARDEEPGGEESSVSGLK